MKLFSKIETQYLDKVRYTPEYYPFSPRFNKELNQELYELALKNEANQSSLSIISLGSYFNENFHKKLTQELEDAILKLNLPFTDIREFFIAILNEQELLNKIKYEEYLQPKSIVSAFDRQNAVLIRKDDPNHPHNFTAFSEMLIEYGNHLFRYLAVAQELKIDRTITMKESEIFRSLSELRDVTQKHLGIKSHYDSCLFYNGEIRLLEGNALLFDSKAHGNLLLMEKVAVTMIGNQHRKNLNQMHEYFKGTRAIEYLTSTVFSKKAIESAHVSGNQTKYKLRSRSIEDCISSLGYEFALEDYYPFYYKEPLKGLDNITVAQLLHLDTEFSSFICEIYDRKFPNPNIEKTKIFKNNFAPRIKESVLKSYLKNVTRCSDSEIETYLRIITMKKSARLNLFAAPLIREEDFFYFPYLPLVARNPFYLVDYWLEEAGENMDARGKALERKIKEELKHVKVKEHNIFQLIDQQEFKVSKAKKEEIDLLIQTKNSLIIGEIKCVKYPMYERDYHNTLYKVISKAVKQLNRKCDFLVNNQAHFKDIYSVSSKKLIKVVILNFPVYTGVEIDGVQITDLSTFISYFKAEKMTAWSVGGDEKEKLSETVYYKNEEEFSLNIDNYLINNPLILTFKEQLRVTEVSYQVAGLPKIIHTDVIPIDSDSMLIEK